VLALFAEVLGAALLVSAAALVFVPAGLAVAGVFLLAAGWAADR
jgi:flagellar biosynthesis protein FliQ